MISAAEAPRVLVVNGEPIGSGSATGITLANLFAGWPADRLVEIFTADLRRPLDAAWLSRRLSNADLRLIGAAFRRGADTAAIPGSAGAPARARSGIQTAARSAVVPWLDLVPYTPPSTLLAEIEAFRPQVIYSLLGNIRLTRLCRALSAAHGVPVVPHFMDDWLSTYSVPGRSAATFVSRPVLSAEVRRLVARTPRGMTIGDRMAEEYARRFGRPFTAFMNPVSITSVEDRSLDPSRARLGYVGGLHLSRWRNLLDIARALDSLRREGFELTLDVWSPPADIARHGEALTAAGARCGSLSPDETAGVLRSLDVAIHVEAFGPREAAYTRLSVSTKIPQYFAAGLPILAYGPADAASCRYIVDNGCGVGAGAADEDLGSVVREMVRDVAARRRMGASGRAVAARRHNAETERLRFRDTLAVAAREGVPR